MVVQGLRSWRHATRLPLPANLRRRLGIMARLPAAAAACLCRWQARLPMPGLPGPGWAHTPLLPPALPPAPVSACETALRCGAAVPAHAARRAAGSVAASARPSGPSPTVPPAAASSQYPAPALGSDMAGARQQGGMCVRRVRREGAPGRGGVRGEGGMPGSCMQDGFMQGTGGEKMCALC